MTCTDPLTVAFAAGAVTATVGGTVSGGAFATVTATAALVDVLPSASRATAVSVCGPLSGKAVTHVAA